MNKLKELQNRLILRMNKKPQGRMSFYLLYIALPWIFIGFLIAMLLAILNLMASADAPRAWMGLTPLFLLTVIWIFFTIRTDSRKGYIDVIYEHYVKRWAENIARVKAETMEVNTETEIKKEV